ncbi:unnamed protein product, partial [Meganyctiphanes norvegica]
MLTADELMSMNVNEVNEPSASTSDSNHFNILKWGQDIIMPPAASSPLGLDYVVVEIDRYQSERLLLFTDNPIDWWAMNAQHYTRLSKIAIKLMACSPSSVERERIFSTGSKIYN